MVANRKLLPIKAHFFFFNAGTAPLVPYLSTYARQLGFSSATVGLIYSILPVFGLIAKPLFGFIADRYEIQKTLFIFFQIFTILSFMSIYAIPSHRNLKVELDCDNGIPVLQTCYASKDLVDECKINATLSNQPSNATSKCQMTCQMKSPEMWQTVCEYWQIPQYCELNTPQNIRYSPTISNITFNNNNCFYMNASSVLMEGVNHIPRCRVSDSVNVNDRCSLTCSNKNLQAAFGDQTLTMTCVNNNLNYELCTNYTEQLLEVSKQEEIKDCEASCDLDVKAPWRLRDICDWWQVNQSSYCHPISKGGEDFPTELSFTGVVILSSTITEHECVYLRLKHIEIPDDKGNVSVHYPSCASQSLHKRQSDFFQSTCDIICDNVDLNEIIEAATDSQVEHSTSQYTNTFFIFFALMITSWIGQAVVVTFADAICFDLLGSNVTHYGRQRLWGSVGWGIFSLLTGFLVDLSSDGAYKDYTVAFILMFILMSADVVVSCFLKAGDSFLACCISISSATSSSNMSSIKWASVSQLESPKVAMNILSNVGSLLSSVTTVLFLLWTIAVGMCTGLLWQFLFWLIEDIANVTCTGSNYVKTLQGLVSAIQTFGGEIPCLFLWGNVLKKVGHVNMMTIVLLAFGVRFILYSFLTNPWLILPIEMLQGITFGMFYPTMTSFANLMAVPGTEVTVQGIVGAIFEGVGTALGSFIGGHLYGMHGGWTTFQMFGIGALVCSVLNWFAFRIVKKLRLEGPLAENSYPDPADFLILMQELSTENDEQ